MGYCRKRLLKHDVGKIVSIVSQACLVGTQACLVQLPYSFLTQFSFMGCCRKECRKLDVGKLVSRAHFDIVVRT